MRQKYQALILFTALIMVCFTPGFYLFSTEIEKKPAGDQKFEMTFSENTGRENITGRVYLIMSKNGDREPRLQRYPNNSLMWGVDIFGLKAGETAVIDEKTFGFPITTLKDIPPGDYFVQGFINVYTEFKRSDGFTLWMHNDQWEGQHWNRSPGNLYSESVKISFDPQTDTNIKLICDKIIPPVQIPEDTEFVKRIKIKSEMLTKFWGQPIYLGATVLLPKGYDSHQDVYYPVNYIQGHFSLRSPYGFRPDRSNHFWLSESTPRMIAVTFQHPCPYYDDSYVVNSPNVGPYQDAIMEELIPKIEKEFRIIREPYARILSGGSTGGWISLMLQIMQPDFFGGTFSLCPDPVDFHYFQCVDIYNDNNAYFKEFGWIKVPTSSDRSTDGIVRFTYQQRNYKELVLGTKNRTGDQIDIFEAAFGPVGNDGYVKPLFDKLSGNIDPQVAEYWKKHYDLTAYLKNNWSRIGAKLTGKLHIYTGDMDTYYLNNDTKLLEKYLESTTDPYYAGVVEYGDGQPHCWGPRGVDLINLMAELITKNAPEGANTSGWIYK